MADSRKRHSAREGPIETGECPGRHFSYNRLGNWDN